MKIGKIIVFRVLANNTKLVMNKFCREFYGYMDRSCNYKYTYRRKGFLENFVYIKPLRSVLVVRKEDAVSIIEFLKRYNAEIYARDIILEKPDIKIFKK